MWKQPPPAVRPSKAPRLMMPPNRSVDERPWAEGRRPVPVRERPFRACPELVEGATSRARKKPGL